MNAISKRIGILSIATNGYLDYWVEMLNSAADHLKLSEIDFYIFTNEIAKVEKFQAENPVFNIHTFPIENYKWPEATLLRYELLESRKSEITNPIVVYLDADMLIRADFVEKIVEESKSWEAGLLLVSHPGYWRPKGRMKFYATHPRIALKDLSLRIVYGGIGSWERDTLSKAFVPRKLRERYVCGGIWLGRRDPLFQMIATLAADVRSDYDKGRIAIWHDESHLNQWASFNPHSASSPELCFEPRYPQLAGLLPIIEAVNKADSVKKEA